jgi:plastocyanin
MRKLLLSLTVLALGFGGVFFANSPGASAKSRAAATTIITGSVGSASNADAFVIAVSATTIAPGTYQFNIHDYSSIHNFDLCKGTSCTGSNSLHKTSVGGTGSVSWTVTLTAGTYSVQCDVHSSIHKTFKVAPTVAITSVVANRTLVTATAKASYSTHFTASLLKSNGTTKLASTATSANATTATLKLKPTTALTPGTYFVQVTVGCCGAFTVVRKKITVM